MSGSTKLGWLLINLTMLALIIVEPRLPGLTHQAVWGGLLCAFALTLWSILPPPRAFRRVGLIPVLLVGQAACWTVIWGHNTWTLGTFACWVAVLLMLTAWNALVVVSREPL